jgi:hypothetical protein
MPAKRSTKRKPKKDEVSLLLGVGLDGSDGHKRVTKGRDFVLVGGSKDTHEVMTEHAIRINEELDRRGIRLKDVRCADELREIVVRAKP